MTNVITSLLRKRIVQ